MKFGCSISIFLNSAKLICQSTDISKCLRGSLLLRANESRLYFLLSRALFLIFKFNMKVFYVMGKTLVRRAILNADRSCLCKWVILRISLISKTNLSKFFIKVLIVRILRDPSTHVSTVELHWLEQWWLAYHGCFELALESLGKNPLAAA